MSIPLQNLKSYNLKMIIMQRLIQLTTVLFFLININAFSQSQPTLAADVIPGADGSSPNHLTSFNGKLYFQATDASFDQELWEYDGATATQVADINPVGSSIPSDLIVYNNKLYFKANNDVSFGELWEYDGVNAPAMVENLYPGFSSSNPGHLAIFNDTLYFQANDSTHGIELFKYGGSGSIELVADIVPGTGHSIPSGLTVFNGVLYFAADNGTNGIELWQYTGAEAPTMVHDIQAGINSSSPAKLTVYNNKLYFTANDGTNGVELWEYDGMNTPTMVHDINSGSSSSSPAHFALFNNKLYFAADDGVNGVELWEYDGMNTPTMVHDIYAGLFNGSFPEALIVYLDTLYFSANDGINGAEIWKYDGTNTPEMLTDLWAGIDGSYMASPALYKSKLYFNADDGSDIGQELWYIDNFCGKYSSFSVSVCDAYTSPSGKIWTSSNTYLDTIDVVGICDTFFTINLTVNHSNTGILDDTADFVYTSPDGLEQWTTSGTYMDTVFNSKGCDSVITINLHIKGTTILIDTFDCASYTSPTGNITWTESGVFGDTIDNPGDNDTLYLVILDILGAYQVIPTVVCDSFVLSSGTVVYTSGTYYDTLPTPNQYGCDSILVYDLNVSTGEKTFSPIFTEETSVPFEAISFGSVAIADVDGDDKPDVLIAGESNSEEEIAKLYKNNGGNNFSEVPTPFSGLYGVSVAIADVDGDDKPDVLITGSSGSGRISKLYKNNGGNSFTEVPTPFPGVYWGSVAISDVDGDDKPDVLITGGSNSGRISKLYKNNGGNSFTEVSTPFTEAEYSSVTISDVDGDDKPDVLITGRSDSWGLYAKLYKNNGGNSFTEVTPMPFTGVLYGSVAIADVDGDDKPDVLITGMTNGGILTAKLYKNNGGNNFSEVSTPFEGVYVGSVAIADVDGDDKPDVLITGESNSGKTTKLYKNNGGNNFSEVLSTPFEEVYYSSVAISDVDGDDKPDVLITGYSSPGIKTKLYKNKSLQLIGACIAPTACNEYTSPSGKIWTASGEYRDTLHIGSGVDAYDSIITVNLLIDTLVADFTIDYNPPAGEDVGAIIVNKAKGNNKTYLWDFGDGNTSTLKLPEHTYASTGSYELCLTVSNSNCTDTFCQTLNITGKTNGPLSIKTIDQTEGSDDPSVGIKESPSAGGQALSFNLFPNPTTDALNIINNNEGQFDVIVRDLSGREVMNVYNQENNTSLDLSTLKSGLYMVEVWSDGKKGYYKVMKD